MAKSMIETLQEELAAKRQKVVECEEDKLRKMDACDRALAKAKADVDAYVAKVSEALGLPNPVAREEKRLATLALKKRVRELLTQGKTTAEVVEEVCAGDAAAVEPAVVEEMVAKLRGKNRPATEDKPEHGSKRERIRELFLEGKTRLEIAEELGIDRTNVNAHITQLRNSGRLPKPEEVAEDAGGVSDDADDSDGDSLEDLRAEVARQQAGSRNKAVRLVVLANGEHVGHVAVVDRMGDGVTVPDETGHQHVVHRFVVGGAAGHRHGLLAKEAA